MPGSVLYPYLEVLYPESAGAVQSAILARVKDRPVKVLGSGGFGVAYKLKSGRALKLTSDPDEIRTAAYLMTVDAPSSLTTVRDVFLVRPEYSWQPPTGVIVRESVDSVISQTKRPKFKQEKIIADAINAAYHAAQITQISFSEDEGVALDDEDALCEGMGAYADVLAEYLESGKLGDHAYRLLSDYRDGIMEMTEMGICGSDFRLGNVGYDKEEDKIAIFDLGRTSSPDEPVPEVKLMTNPPEDIEVVWA